MKKVYTKLDYFQMKIENLCSLLAGLSLIAMLLLVTVDVILRKLMNYTIPGVYEISMQLMVGTVLLSIAYVQRKKEHIDIDIFTKKLSSSVKKIIKISYYLIAVILMFIFSWKGFEHTLLAWSSNEHTFGIVAVPLWPGKFLAALAFLTIGLRFLLDLIIETSSSQIDNEETETDLH